jgi:DNA-binding winged helix-turn-helix (wHTH) protein
MFDSTVRLQFDDFVFDSDTRQFSRSGEVLHTSPKAFRLLEILLTSRPKAFSKKELLESIWPDTFVDEGNLATLVTEIREILGDDARHSRFLRTVYGFGYAFCAEARALSASDRKDQNPGAAFRLLWGEREIGLAEGEHVLGRDAETQIWIDSVAASRRHAKIVISGSEATLEDLGSKNGTILNGRILSGRAPLKDGDRIQIAHASLTLRVFSSTGSTATRTGD